MVKRGLDVISTGVQRFRERFPGKRRRLDDDLPRISQWRNNLTALSTTCNLYFIAYGAEIWVYEPLFPSQALPAPSLIIPSRPSAPELRGQLDPRHPNDINNLLISYLGTEEVVAVVRDDGDVDVFLIRHLLHAVDIRAAAVQGVDITCDEVKPVFQYNVGASCWGLAIHSHARVIAVSSNSHEVVVFRFGLVTDQQDEGSYDAHKRVYNGRANIPCVAFCNTADDLNAQYLLTTDINGMCRTFNLVSGIVCTQNFRFGQHADLYGYNFDRHNAGWTAAFLDQRSFVLEDSFYDALGMAEDDQLPDSRDNPYVWDLSQTTKSSKDFSQAFIRHQTPVKAAARRQPVDITEAIQPSETEMLDEDMTGISSASMSSSDSSHTSVVHDLELYEDEGTEDTTPPSAYYDGQRICGNLPIFSRKPTQYDCLPCPAIFASVRNIYLLQPGISNDLHWRPPFVGMAAPLRQQIQSDHISLNVFERLNMSVHLPELGIFVIASQKGRVLLLALTKLSRSAKFPDGSESFSNQTCYGFRAEAILPTAEQEQQNLRPFEPLHGIAAAPLQGSEALLGHQKRWRLMLMYQDHTMLSYEIARRSDGLPQVVV